MFTGLSLSTKNNQSFVPLFSLRAIMIDNDIAHNDARIDIVCLRENERASVFTSA